MYKFLNTFLKIFGHSVDSGEMLLAVSGCKEIEVKLDFTPRHIWLNLRAPHCIPVCQGNTDCFDVRIVPNGFVITVKLNSEFREVEWVAIK